MQTRKPEWLRKNRTLTHNTHRISELFTKHNLHSVCHEARCPNLQECYTRKIATFLLMGNICTRACRFCQIHTRRKPGPIDPQEPKNVAKVAKELGLRHVVLTSVTRDDLPDEGIAHFMETIQACREQMPEARIEILTPDFHANSELFAKLAETPPDIFNHNLETIERLQKHIRPFASYETSLKALTLAKKIFPNNALTKSGLMVGLGETDEEVLQACQDLADHGVSILTLGQYLRPSQKHEPVHRFVHPDQFALYKKEALQMGYKYVFSGPYVRSSYMADFQVNEAEKAS